MYIKRFLFILLLFLFCITSYASNLNVTKITNKNNKINIEFNNILQLHDFTLTDDNLMSPFYENNGNKYYFFYFLDRNLKKDIIDKINNKNNSFSKDNDKIEYKINKCNIVKNPKTILAFMSVIFNPRLCSRSDSQYPVAFGSCGKPAHYFGQACQCGDHENFQRCCWRRIPHLCRDFYRL